MPYMHMTNCACVQSGQRRSFKPIQSLNTVDYISRVDCKTLASQMVVFPNT